MASSSSTIYVPIASPPTPAPSPSLRPLRLPLHDERDHPDATQIARSAFACLLPQGSTARHHFLLSLLEDCTPTELLFLSAAISPLLRRDFLSELPYELAVHVLSFIGDAHTLAQVARVSRYWHSLLQDEAIWRTMCERHKFEGMGDSDPIHVQELSQRQLFKRRYKTLMNWRNRGKVLHVHRLATANQDDGVATSVAMDDEWIVVGLANSRIHVFSAKSGVLCRTLIGHASGVWTVNLVSRGGRPPHGDRVHGLGLQVSQTEGDLETKARDGHDRLIIRRSRSLDGSLGGDNIARLPSPIRAAIGLDKFPEAATWNPTRDDNFQYGEKQSDPCSASDGWGNENALVVTGGCDKVLRVWDVQSGYCIHTLAGHTSTIRCARILHGRPIAVTGSRDASLRVWDIQRGRLLRVLLGHEQSVRCLDVFGNKAVSGSYDCTCRLWNVDTGECLQILSGHFHQIYSVVYDGIYIASGALDTTVRVWNPENGQCLALLQGHSALVCQLQLVGTTLATGGSDGRVITFGLPPHPDLRLRSSDRAAAPSSSSPTDIPPGFPEANTFRALRRIAAHDSSVTALQLNQHFLVTGGNDGKVKLFEAESGAFIRNLSQPAEAVWKVAHRGDVCVVTCRRAGKTVMEIWSFRVEDVDAKKYLNRPMLIKDGIQYLP